MKTQTRSLHGWKFFWFVISALIATRVCTQFYLVAGEPSTLPGISIIIRKQTDRFLIFAACSRAFRFETRVRPCTNKKRKLAPTARGSRVRITFLFEHDRQDRVCLSPVTEKKRKDSHSIFQGKEERSPPSIFYLIPLIESSTRLDQTRRP